MLLTNKQVTFLKFSDHLLIKILPTPILFFTRNNLCLHVRAKIIKKKNKNKYLGNKWVVSTVPSRTARTSTILTVAKKFIYNVVKATFLHHKLISIKTHKASEKADLLIHSSSYNRLDSTHEFFHWLSQ